MTAAVPIAVRFISGPHFRNRPRCPSLTGPGTRRGQEWPSPPGRATAYLMAQLKHRFPWILKSLIVVCVGVTLGTRLRRRRAATGSSQASFTPGS